VIVGAAGCDIVFPLTPPPPVDAAVVIDMGIDADPFACPVTYTPAIGENSVYRFFPGPLSWKNAETMCELDDPMHPARPNIHLVVPSTITELAHVQSVIANAQFLGIVWIGIARDSTSSGGKQDYIEITGGPASLLLWAPGQPHGGGLDFAVRITRSMPAMASDAMMNENFNSFHAFVCECDRQPPIHDYGF
jgi:hypothetical protein